MVKPSLVASVVALLLHSLLCWTLVHALGLGFTGAAVANTLSPWVRALLILIYLWR